MFAALCFVAVVAISLLASYSAQTIDVPESVSLGQSGVSYWTQIPLPPPGGPIAWQSFDVPPVAAYQQHCPQYPLHPAIVNCGWSGTAFGDTLAVSTGAYVFDGNCQLALTSLTPGKQAKTPWKSSVLAFSVLLADLCTGVSACV